MQILGKRSKVLLIALCAVMLIAIGISFAAWDSTAVKADSGNISDYANAKVGDIVTFGRYYDYEKDANGNYVEGSTVIDKYPMTWIVVDKNERTGQLTLMSQYIIACGSYFGNFYMDTTGGWGHCYGNNIELDGKPYNQAYCESTIRAYLNNLERLDLGGDQFVAPNPTAEMSVIGGYVPSGKKSTPSTGLLASVGFSNQRYFTALTSSNFADYKNTPGFFKRADTDEIYYKRPLSDVAYSNRPAAKGFYDEAFTDEEKSKIVPKAIAGYIGNHWSNGDQDISTKSYIAGTVDKVWIPSATELNAINDNDWTGEANAGWMNPSDKAGSTVFEYFKNFLNYNNPYASRKNKSLGDALVAQRTMLAKDGIKGNYSVPVYNKGNSTKALTVNENISKSNTSDFFWTRSPSSYWGYGVRVVEADTGWFGSSWATDRSHVGVRPCITLQY